MKPGIFSVKVRRIHFVGIGGIGMSGIAEILVNLGFAVTGSDAKPSDNTRRLEELGVRVYIGHEAGHADDADVVVYSSAVMESNPELAQARARGVPTIARAEMLAEFMRMQDAVAVAGSHGKTTTTSMIAHVLTEAGLDPTYVIGGRFGRHNAKLGQGGLMVAEADESDGTFLKLTPVFAVVTTIDREHIDYYSDFDNIRAAFAQFLNRVPFYGAVVVCVDQPVVRELLPRLTRRHVGYGTAADAELRADAVALVPFGAEYDLIVRGKRVTRVRLSVPGMHNVLNSLAALGIADELGIPLDTAARALTSFGGVGRRFEKKGEAAGVTVIDDYGHHPAEIEATLAAARTCGPARVVAVFQPHRYTRARDQFHDFARCFRDADVVVASEIYAAGEAPIAGIDGRALARAIEEQGGRAVTFAPGADDAVAAVAALARPGDLVLTLGAGDVTRWGPRILEALRHRAAAAEVAS